MSTTTSNSVSHDTSSTSSAAGSITETRAMEMLASGLSMEVVASALGVSISRISQIAAQEDFATELATRRYENLTTQNIRDNKADSIEDKLLAKMDMAVDLLYKPLELAAVYKVVNNARRRGAVAPTTHQNVSVVVNLQLPTQIIQRFKVTADNQIIEAGGQNLITMQSATLASLANHPDMKELPNDLPTNLITAKNSSSGNL